MEAAKSAGLHYVCERDRGIFRRRKGSRLYYVDVDGKRVRDKKVLDRIAALVLPPAWDDVWICADERGHIQAIGYDQRGRRQYRYHMRCREVRDANKYEHMLDFAKALPRIRRRLRSKNPRPPEMIVPKGNSPPPLYLWQWRDSNGEAG